MNLLAFPAATTNIFPAANSTTGSQLLTEFNIRSRESVLTPSEVKYMIGPSYTHSQDDFAVSLQLDGSGTVINNNAIQISPGRAVVNGHYLESLAPVVIDMTEANYRLAKDGQDILQGELMVGIRMMYSTEKTLAGSIMVENENGYFEGVHVVILPKSKFKLPSDTPGDESKVTAHLLLASFTYINGVIANLTNNENKIQAISAERVGDFNTLLANDYLDTNNLDPHKIYAVSGAKDSVTNKPTWQDATGSLIIWDSDPVLKPGSISNVRSARFEYDSSTSSVNLVMPHLQNAGQHMYNTAGDRVYYQDAVLPLPSANFGYETGGVVTPAYTKRLKSIESKIDNFYHVVGGNLIQYIPYLSEKRKELPKLPEYTEIGDSIDLTFGGLVALINTTKGELQTELNNLKESISNLQDTVDHVSDINEAEIEQILNEQLKDVLDAIDDLKQRVATLEGKVSAETPSGSGVTPEVQELIDAINAQLAELDGTLTTLSNSVVTIKETTIPALKREENNDIAQTNDRIDDIYTVLGTDFEDLSVRPRLEYSESLIRAIGSIRYDISLIRNSIGIVRNTIIPGDYVLVGQDASVGDFDKKTLTGRNPSTMYVVIPGYVATIGYIGHDEEWVLSDPNRELTLEEYKRRAPKLAYGGVCLSSCEVEGIPTQGTDLNPVNAADMFTNLEVTSHRGICNKDYFAVYKVTHGDSGEVLTAQAYWYTPTGNTGSMEWSIPPVILTGQIPLATESTIGGFLNSSLDDVGQGYVIRDDDGRLRLVDYKLLSSGVLAYQLGQDATSSKGLALEELQDWINNYINYRVAFPNYAHLSKYSSSSAQRTINVTVDISEWKGNNVLYIGNIDSRFGTSVYLHLVGTVSEGTVIQITDIEKLRIDIGSLSGSPYITLRNCGLYYDATVINALSEIEGLTLWYEADDDADPEFIIDGMTVESCISPVSNSSQDFWGTTSGGDFSYKYALRSLTFAHDGSIIGIGMLVTDGVTTGTQLEGSRIYATDFKIPQSMSLPYPEKMMTRQLKVSGSFVTAYPETISGGYVVKDNNFTILTQKFDGTKTDDQVVKGTFSVYTKYSVVSNVVGTVGSQDIAGRPIDGWESGRYHLFYGGIVD